MHEREIACQPFKGYRPHAKCAEDDADIGFLRIVAWCPADAVLLDCRACRRRRARFLTDQPRVDARTPIPVRCAGRARQIRRHPRTRCPRNPHRGGRRSPQCGDEVPRDGASVEIQTPASRSCQVRLRGAEKQRVVRDLCGTAQEVNPVLDPRMRAKSSVAFRTPIWTLER